MEGFHFFSFYLLSINETATALSSWQVSSLWHLSDWEVLCAPSITTVCRRQGHCVMTAELDVTWVMTSNCSLCVRVLVACITIREGKPPPDSIWRERISLGFICCFHPPPRNSAMHLSFSHLLHLAQVRGLKCGQLYLSASTEIYVP